MNDLNSLMHASVDGARPDVDRLLAGAMRDGQRLQRRRRISYAGAGLAVAAIAVAGPLAAGSLGGHHARELAPASGGPVKATDTDVSAGPANPTLEPGQTFDLGPRLTGTVVACTDTKDTEPGVSPDCILPAQYAIQGSSSIPGAGTGFAIVLTGPAKAINDFSSNGFQDPQLDAYKGLSWALNADNPLIQPIYQGQDVAIHVRGWKQVGKVADDKQSLEGPGGAVATIVWRAAKDYDAWISDSDKGDNASTWTSPVHDGVFVTIQGSPSTSSADIQALGASLTWK